MESEQVRDKYTGQTASGYERKRSGSKKWNNEQDAVELLLHKVIASQKVDTVLDIPVGTGRFIPLYNGLDLGVTGMDVSEDMISEAKKKANHSNFQMTFQKGDILDLSTINADPDLIINIRLLNWFSLTEVSRVLENCHKLEPEYVIAGVRTQPTSEISVKKKIWLGPAQVGSQILNNPFSNKNSINIHPEQKIIEEMSKNYTIENRILVDVGTSPSNFESEYYVYLLKSNSSPHQSKD